MRPAATGRAAGRAALLAGPALVLAAVFATVRPTNFGGHDEWLVVDLVRRGILGFPYAGRPLDLLWTAPGALLTPHDLLGYWIVHVAYLGIAGGLVAWMGSRWLRLPAAVAFLAGAFAASWAPRDAARLNTVLVGRYSGAACGALAGALLFVAGWRRFREGRRAAGAALGVAGAAAAATTLGGLEAALTLLAGAPLIAWAARPADVRRHLRRFAAWSFAFELVLAGSVLPRALALRAGGADYQYQSAVGLDPHPLRMGRRVLRQYAMHLLPLATTPPAELKSATVPLALAAFAIAFAGAARTPFPRAGARLRAVRRRMWRAAALGVVLAALGYLTLALSPLIDRPARTQVLSAPGIGLLLASLAGLAATRLPRGSATPALALFGAWVIAVAAGRAAAMQRDWDRLGYWARQRATLVQLTSLAPALADGTLVVLADDSGAWRASFTFRHAVRLMYGDGVLGHVANGHPFLYPVRFAPDGAHVEPFPSIRAAWRAPPTVHRYEEILAARLRSDGRLELLDAWPAKLPPLPAGARYAPRARIVAGAEAPPARAILARER